MFKFIKNIIKSLIEDEISKIYELDSQICNVMINGNKRGFKISKIYMNNHTLHKVNEILSKPYVSDSENFKTYNFTYRGIPVETDNKLDDYKVSFSFKGGLNDE